MNTELRRRALDQKLPLTDYILKRIEELRIETGIPRTLFAACPNSIEVIKAALISAKRSNAPIKFAATLNQVDSDGGYTGLTQQEFVNTIREQARIINFKGPVIIAIDHGGPWLKDKHRVENLSYTETMDAVKRSFEDAVFAGYDLIHVDPTIDITLPKNEIISIDTVAERTLELIAHTETFRKKHDLPRISYEVGTEEVHGGLANMETFNRFLNLLKKGLKEQNMEDIWPCFVVGKVGTDLHTTYFDMNVAKELTKVASKYGSLIKGHYSDNVDNPEDYPLSGMGAANVGPEFTESEYEGLIELNEIEEKLYTESRIVKLSKIKDILWNAVIDSGRWKKWLNESENNDDFYKLDAERQEWLVKTGCRYIWENPEVISARSKLFTNMTNNGIKADEILISHIEHSMDKYFYKFNLTGLNSLL